MELSESPNLIDFRIVLASDNVIPGSAVSGNLTFKITKPLTFQSVTIKAVGKENTHTTEACDAARSFNSGKNVFKQHATILGTLKGDSFKGELPIGEYNFPFAFILPANAPPSIPTVTDGRYSGALNWKVQATIKIPPNFINSLGPTEVKVAVPLIVTTAMPISQYNSRQPYSSPPSTWTAINRSYQSVPTCCGEIIEAFTETVTASARFHLAQDKLVFGRDTALQGFISVKNEEQKEVSSTLNVTLKKVCWVKSVICIGKSMTVNVEHTSVDIAMGAGESEKRFDFSIPLTSGPHLVSCYRGSDIFHYYQVVGTCSKGKTLFTANLLASNALDESNHSLPINVETASPFVQKYQYPRFVYAPPPGTQPTLPQVPNGYIPQPTGTIQPMRYPSNNTAVTSTPKEVPGYAEEDLLRL